MPAATFYQPIEKILEGKCDYEYYNQSTNSYSKANKSRICHVSLQNLNIDIIMMIFTVRNQPSREKPYVWKIHSEGPKRMDQGATVPLRNTAVKLAQKNKWKYIAIAVASEDVPTSDIISEYVISMESYQYGNETVYDLSNDLEKIKNLGKPNFYRTEVTLNGVRYSFSFIRKDRLIDYLNMFDNRPYDISSKDNEAKDKFIDILEHTLYGIHIKNRNDALSKENPHICIGWSGLGDLNFIQSKEMLIDKYNATWPEKKKMSVAQDVGQIWRFINEASIGDYVVLAEPGLIHIGRIESNYYYDSNERTDQDSDYVNNRKVTWIKTNIDRSQLSNSFHHSLGATMSFFTINDYRAAVIDLLNDGYVKDEFFEDIEEGAANDQNSLLEFDFSSSIDDGQNLIVFGTPGCGKSYYVENELLKDFNKDNIFRTTFYLDYTNTDFVGQILPHIEKDENDKDIVTYKFNPGPFALALKQAVLHKNEKIALVVEELNRGNAPAIFGDVFQLLDRDENGISRYEITNINLRDYLNQEPNANFNKIKIPGNLYIYATMNTSDQNVFTLDTAFKRRWESLKLKNTFDTYTDALGYEHKHDYKSYKVPGMNGVTWQQFVDEINKAIIGANGERDNSINVSDKQIGVYFVDKEGLHQENIMIDELNDKTKAEKFAYKVFSYLWDDVAKFDKDKLFAKGIITLDKLIEKYINHEMIFEETLSKSLIINADQKESGSSETE